MVRDAVTSERRRGGPRRRHSARSLSSRTMCSRCAARISACIAAMFAGSAGALTRFDPLGRNAVYEVKARGNGAAAEIDAPLMSTAAREDGTGFLLKTLTR